MALRSMLASVVALALLTSFSFALAPTAGADPSDDSCPLSMVLLCRLIPTAPDLDGDVDLTKQQPPADSTASPVDPSMPADVCSNGCI
jgi:hypothetical protein